MAKAKGGFGIERVTKAKKKTRQGQGRGTKFSTRVGSKRFKKKYRGQGKWSIPAYFKTRMGNIILKHILPSIS